MIPADQAWAIARKFEDRWTISQIKRSLSCGFSTIQKILAEESKRRGIPPPNADQLAVKRAMNALVIDGRCELCDRRYDFTTEDGEAVQSCGCGAVYIRRRPANPVHFPG